MTWNAEVVDDRHSVNSHFYVLIGHRPAGAVIHEYARSTDLVFDHHRFSRFDRAECIGSILRAWLSNPCATVPLFATVILTESPSQASIAGPDDVPLNVHAWVFTPSPRSTIFSAAVRFTILFWGPLPQITSWPIRPAKAPLTAREAQIGRAHV